MARNDVFLNINALSPADAVVTGQQDMTAATVPELVLGDTPTFNFYFTDNTNVWPSWAGNAAYTVTWALSDAVAGDFAPAATTGNATPITGGWSVILPLNSYDLVGLLNTKRVGQPYPVQNLWQQLRVTDPSGNEVTRAMFWTPVRYRAISDTQNTESASPTGGRFVTVNNVNTLTTPIAAQFYAANPVPTSALGTAANGELLIGNGTGFTKATLTAGSGVSITNGSGSITITATDGDITLDDGTAAAPSLKFTADTDTGLFRPSDNVVGISAGGVSRATFGATSAINGTTIPGSKTLVVTTDKLSALAATTSAELAGVISDETGTGALVFANTPTLVTPNIGAATGTSFNLTGSGTLGTTLTVNGTTDSSSKDTGAIVTEGGLGVEKSATIGGNLTVSGTGTSSFAGPVTGTSSTNGYQWTLTGSGVGGPFLALDATNATVANRYSGLTLFSDGTFQWGLQLRAGDGKFHIYDGVRTVSALTVDVGPLSGVAGTTTVGGNLTVSGGTIGTAAATNLTLNGGSSGASLVLAQGSSDATALTANVSLYLQKAAASAIVFRNNAAGSYTEAMRIAGTTGNLLIGTTTDGGQKLQVAGSASITGALSIGNRLNFDTGNAAGVREIILGSTFNSGRWDILNGSTAIASISVTGGIKSNVGFRADVGSGPTSADYGWAGSSGFYSPSANVVSLTANNSRVASWSTTAMTLDYTTASTSTTTGALVVSGGVGVAGAVNVGGAISIGNTVNTVSPTSPNRTITMVIGGTTYYIHAKTTND